MKFEWDENKNKRNKEKHGLDFNDAAKVFEDKHRLKSQDKRNDYGEIRWITIGKMMHVIIVVVYTIRNAVFRIISARMANKKERSDYNRK